MAVQLATERIDQSIEPWRQWGRRRGVRRCSIDAGRHSGRGRLERREQHTANRCDLNAVLWWYRLRKRGTQLVYRLDRSSRHDQVPFSLRLEVFN
jgi:hypothetical protein